MSYPITEVVSGTAQRVHYLVAIAESTVRLGRPTTLRNVGIVNVGNAKTVQEAEAKAKRRYAKANGTNPIVLAITEITVVRPAPKAVVDPAFSVTELAAEIGVGNWSFVATAGAPIVVKVRKA